MDRIGQIPVVCRNYRVRVGSRRSDSFIICMISFETKLSNPRAPFLSCLFSPSSPGQFASRTLPPHRYRYSFFLPQPRT